MARNPNVIIKIAQRDLAMDETAYRALLERVTGQASSTKLSTGQRGRMLYEFRRMGWQSKPSQGRYREPSANPLHRKIWALGKELDRLGYWKLPWKEGLKKFVKGETGIDDPDWLDTRQASDVIEALKAIVRRTKRKGGGK